MRSALAIVLLLAAWVPAARASAPDWSGSFGRTLAINSRPDGGGFDARLAAMWPVEGRFSIGATAIASDMGLTLGRLTDVHSGTDLGELARQHRAVYGLAWRLDADVRPVGGWDPFGSATWGFYSVNDELHGNLQGRVAAAGFGLGGGLRRQVGDRGALGASLRYTRMFNDRLGRYMSAGVDWVWRGAR